MERIISYDEIPHAIGRSVYFRMETDPTLYIKLMSKGYRIVNNILDASKDTIYITGRRQSLDCTTAEEYYSSIDDSLEESLRQNNIVKPKTKKFSFYDLVNHKYQIPFVFKNEGQNGGKEKFLIATEEDYENLINACEVLLDRNLLFLTRVEKDDELKHSIDYEKYIQNYFTIQEYIETPSKYNTTVRIITTPSKDTLYASLKYNEREEYKDDTTILGYLLSDIFPLSTPSIVSNTLSGGENVLLGEERYSREEKYLLDSHHISSDQFYELIDATQETHKKLHSELGIICGFDYIYDKDRDKWFLLEYHSRPMLGDYSKRQGIKYETKEDRLSVDGRVRATALSLVLKKTR